MVKKFTTEALSHGESIQKIINAAPSQPDEAKPDALNREGAKDARKARFESGLNQKYICRMVSFALFAPSR
jgi:hypothetical protein